MYERLAQLLTQYLCKVSLFLFPIECFICKRPDTSLCVDCLSKELLETPWVNKNVVSIASYQNPVVRKALWLLKYGNRPNLANTFGEILHNSLLAGHFFEKEHVRNNQQKLLLVPIPISRERYKKRGYNHAGLIAQNLETRDPNVYEYCADILVKIRHTAPQMTLSKKERLTNLSGAFMATNTIKMRGQTIVLIDDIVTTGATLLEAQKTLQSRGAKKIYCLTIAH